MTTKDGRTEREVCVSNGWELSCQLKTAFDSLHKRGTTSIFASDIWAFWLHAVTIDQIVQDISCLFLCGRIIDSYFIQDRLVSEQLGSVKT